ncbi:MAG: hypothetical protein KAI47_21455, partial [Deltaproteobacteria bacterium]|nr:hypothetical protein [Deltaproteobacteria bacterium]
MGGRRPTFIEIGLGILALGAPLAIGAVHVATIVTLAIIAVLLLGALALRTRHSGDKIAVPWFGAILFGLAAWTAFQALPLPWTLLATIAPKTAAVLEVAFGATARPAWHAMSLAPTATLLEALKVSIVFIAFIVAHNHLSHEGRRQRLLLSFVILASVVTLLGLLGAVVAPGKPLLFYQPQSATRAGGLIATSFVNSNHGGAFLSLSAMAALALALWEENLQRRVMLLAA